MSVMMTDSIPCPECGRTFKDAGTYTAEQLLGHHINMEHAAPKPRVRKTVQRGFGAEAKARQEQATRQRLDIKARDLRVLLAEQGLPSAELVESAVAAVQLWLSDVGHHFRMQPDCGDEQTAVWAMAQLLEK